MRRLGNIFIAILLSSFFFSCEVINPSEELPAYITIKDPQILVDSTTGQLSPLGIKDAWVYQGGFLLGTYKFPLTFPYLNRETSDFFIDAGVYESGLSNFRIVYPFWQRKYYTIDQPALDTFVITPTFEYLSPEAVGTAFAEDFEDISLNFNTARTLDTANLFRTDQDKYYGDFAGRAIFDEDSRYLDLVSDDLEFIPRNIDAWAEITYKTDIPFSVGLYWIDGAPNSISEITYLPTTEWTTVYVHLVSMIRRTPNDPDVPKGLWLYADTGDSLRGDLLIDGIRVLYFK